MGKYLAGFPAGFAKRFHALHESPLSTKSFSFYTSVSAIASSKIEGETMEVDSFIKHRMLKVSFLPDQVQKPDDLYSAYRFAQTHALTRENLLQAHRKITAHLLPAKSRGALRKTEMVVLEHKTNRIQYEAAPAGEVRLLFDDLWKDIRSLKSMELKIPEAFFMASAIHLAFANIHPFEDGNGRAARLLEKWFLADKLGPKAWFLQSELYYYRNVGRYYKSLNRLGMFFQELDYSKALPFLRMLPEAIKLNYSGAH
jgi:Fic family protein